MMAMLAISIASDLCVAALHLLTLCETLTVLGGMCCRKQLSRLFELAGESSSAVQGLASSPEKFWKSAHTQSVIAQEKALKRHLFAQMFEAGADPA